MDPVVRELIHLGWLARCGMWSGREAVGCDNVVVFSGGLRPPSVSLVRGFSGEGIRT
jgi:hypothetical protein